MLTILLHERIASLCTDHRYGSQVAEPWLCGCRKKGGKPNERLANLRILRPKKHSYLTTSALVVNCMVADIVAVQTNYSPLMLGSAIASFRIVFQYRERQPSCSTIHVSGSAHALMSWLCIARLLDRAVVHRAAPVLPRKLRLSPWVFLRRNTLPRYLHEQTECLRVLWKMLLQERTHGLVSLHSSFASPWQRTLRPRTRIATCLDHVM